VGTKTRLKKLASGTCRQEVSDGFDVASVADEGREHDVDVVVGAEADVGLVLGPIQ
jgi:hypothetical protein